MVVHSTLACLSSLFLSKVIILYVQEICSHLLVSLVISRARFERAQFRFCLVVAVVQIDEASLRLACDVELSVKKQLRSDMVELLSREPMSLPASQ